MIMRIKIDGSDEALALLREQRDIQNQLLDAVRELRADLDKGKMQLNWGKPTNTPPKE
jgi:hypothetical protein